MGELLRRGYDAQLADRNTQGYDILVGTPEERVLHKVQIKSVRSVPWYVKSSDFQGDLLDQVTVYVLIGDSKAAQPVRYFLAYNNELVGSLHCPAGWTGSAFMPLKAVKPYEGRWDLLDTLGTQKNRPFPDKFIGDAEAWKFTGNNVEMGTPIIIDEGAPPQKTMPSKESNKSRTDQDRHDLDLLGDDVPVLEQPLDYRRELRRASEGVVPAAELDYLYGKDSRPEK